MTQETKSKEIIVSLRRQETTKHYTKNGRSEKGTIGILRVFFSDSSPHVFIHPITKKQQDFLYTMENEKYGFLGGKDLAIPEGSYRMEWCDTLVCVPKEYRNKSKCTKKHRGLTLFYDKSNENYKKYQRSGIRIHIGNSAIDTEGCPLLGFGRTECTITESTIAVKLFYDLMKELDLENVRFIAQILRGQMVRLVYLHSYPRAHL